jgi:hypothetical protein
MKHNKEENDAGDRTTRQGDEQATLDGQQAIVQYSQLKLRNESLLLASHYYMNLDLKR